MRLSKMMGAVVVAALALAAAGGDISAANKKTTKTYVLNSSDPDAEKACTDLGGTVSVAPNGDKLCTLPANVVPPLQTMRESPN